MKQATLLPGPVVLLNDGSEVDPLFTKRRLNDPDLYAVEEALRLCESHGEGEVVVVSVGPETATEALRKCLAMGAHRATRVWDDEIQLHDPLTVARALAIATRQESADLIICGVQSEDTSQQATGPALASTLRLPCVTMATGVELFPDEGRAVIHREASDGGTDVVEVELPLVLTVQTGINTPRAETFKAVMMAKKASISVIDAGDIAKSRIQVVGVTINATARGQWQLIEGGPAEVATKIKDLLREAI